jgi:restriction system protein
MKDYPSTMPTFDRMMKPAVQALKELGGSATIEQIYRKVVEILQLPEEMLAITHTDHSSESEVAYRLAWTRTYLKKAGIFDNTSRRGVWALVSYKIDAESINPDEIVRSVREADRKKSGGQGTQRKAARPTLTGSPALTIDADTPEEASPWHEQLHKVLLTISPAAFERLAQRLLRESGFIEVEVTGKSSDGGIDGVGIARISGFLSFRVLFQCKRYQGSVSPSQIRDFRGAMMGRTDKGLFITTGTFTREAVKEATRDGAPPIDLIDGEQLVRRLKELGLGVKIRMVEAVEIDTSWFDNL